MKKKRKKYSQEFKEEAVKLIIEQGYQIAEAVNERLAPAARAAHNKSKGTYGARNRKRDRSARKPLWPHQGGETYEVGRTQQYYVSICDISNMFPHYF